MPQPIPTWLLFAGLARETTWGTPVTATTFFPILKPKHVVKFETILDEGFRSNASKDQAYYQGVGRTEIDWPDMLFYPDDSGHLLMGILGADTTTGTARTGTIAVAAAGATSLTYTVGTGGAPIVGDIFLLDSGTGTGEVVTVTAVSGAGPYTLTVAATRYAHAAGAPATALFQHALTLLNTALPPSYTAVKSTGLQATAEQVAGVNWSDVTLKFTNPGKLTVAVKGVGKIQGTVTKPANTYSAGLVYLPWQATATIAGVANTKLIDAEINLKRPLEAIFGVSGAQDMTGQNVHVLEVTGKLTFASADMTELAYYTGNTQPTLSLVFNNPSGLLTLQMTKAAFIDPTEVDHGSPYARTIASFRAVANATDAGTGNAPFKALVTSGRSATY